MLRDTPTTPGMDPPNALLASAFPLPPARYRLFAGDAAAAALAPPPPPAPAALYRSLGHVWRLRDALPSLAQQGIPDLLGPPAPSASSSAVSPADRVAALSRLFRSLLLKYLELVALMGITPEQFPDRVQDLRVILINMHHLLNEYRPHQVRESLIMLMEDQLERKRAHTRAARDACLHMEEVLSNLAGEVEGATTAADVALTATAPLPPTATATEDTAAAAASQQLTNMERDMLVWNQLLSR
ncbi:MED7 protein-domain-containing protein [Limtongia smithiae]|uniref:MED7 protein-domain-containing protein n=1 Tax=Limtongia smithiae TaxID=1125753 RepID=UPI0034CE1C7A